MKRSLCFVIVLVLCLAAFCACRQDNGEEPDFSPAYFTAAESEEINFFTFDEKLKASYYDYHCVEETGEWEQKVTAISLTEEEKEILLKLLKPYTNTISDDVLKCDYLRYYSIAIDDRMTLTIDPELGNYGESGDSYMLVMEHTPGAFIKGTYIDAELVEFLRDRLAEEG